MKRQDPSPGLLAAVPLKRGGYGVALLARSTPLQTKAFRLALVYGFDRVYRRMPTLEEASSLLITDAIHILKCGDISFRDGRWPTIGLLEHFVPVNWPVPPRIKPEVSSRGSLIPDPLVKRVSLTEEQFMKDVVVPNDGLIDPNDEPQYSYACGLGDRSCLEGTLDLAIRDRFRLHTVEIRATTVALWNEVIDEAKRRGVFPPSIDWTKAKPRVQARKKVRRKP